MVRWGAVVMISLLLACGGGGGRFGGDGDRVDGGGGDGDGDGDGDRADGGGCVPSTCAELGAGCGEIDDGCGGTLSCGGCAAPAVCGGRGQANLCAIPEAERACTPDGWCFENPAPQPMRPLGMAAVAPDDVWAVGERGAIAHFDGERWRVSRQGDAHLRAVWATGGQRAWIAGDGGTLLSWDGSAWSAVTAGQGSAHLGGIAGTGDDDVWVVGHGVTWHFDGSTWLQASLLGPDLDHVFAAPSGELWATGEKRVWSWNGLGWSAETPQPDFLTSYVFHGIHGRSASDVWAVGRSSALFNSEELVYHYDGATWELMDLEGDPWLDDAFGTEGYTAAAGSHGVTMLSEDGPPIPPLEQSIAQGAAIGSFQAAMSSDGHPWRLEDGAWVDDGFGTRALLVALGRAGDSVWIGGAGVLLEWRGGGLREHRPQMWANHQFWSVSGASADDVWAIEGDFVFDEKWRTEAVWHWDGQAWTESELPQNGFSPLLAVRSTESGVLLAGEGAIYRRDGEAWQSVHASPSIWHALDEGDAPWAAGTEPAEEPTESLARIARAGADGWVEETVPGTSVLCGLDVVSESQAWASGYRLVPDGDDFGSDPDPRGTVSHWDGESWTTVDLPAASELCAVVALAADDVYVSGDEGEIFHFDGDAWRPVRLLHAGSIRALLHDGDTLWAVGEHGAVLARSAP